MNWWFSFIRSIYDRGRLLNLYDTAYLDLFFDSFVSLTIRLFTVEFPARQTRRNWVRYVNHSEVQDGQQTLKHVYWTKSCNQAMASRLVTTLHYLSKLRKPAKLQI